MCGEIFQSEDAGFATLMLLNVSRKMSASIDTTSLHKISTDSRSLSKYVKLLVVGINNHLQR